jgi:hypothetical protein
LIFFVELKQNSAWRCARAASPRQRDAPSLGRFCDFARQPAGLVCRAFSGA